MILDGRSWSREPSQELLEVNGGETHGPLMKVKRRLFRYSKGGSPSKSLAKRILLAFVLVAAVFSVSLSTTSTRLQAYSDGKEDGVVAGKSAVRDLPRPPVLLSSPVESLTERGVGDEALGPEPGGEPALQASSKPEAAGDEEGGWVDEDEDEDAGSWGELAGLAADKGEEGVGDDGVEIAEVGGGDEDLAGREESEVQEKDAPVPQSVEVVSERNDVGVEVEVSGDEGTGSAPERVEGGPPATGEGGETLDAETGLSHAFLAELEVRGGGIEDYLKDTKVDFSHVETSAEENHKIEQAFATAHWKEWQNTKKGVNEYYKLNVLFDDSQEEEQVSWKETRIRIPPPKRSPSRTKRRRRGDGGGPTTAARPGSTQRTTVDGEVRRLPVKLPCDESVLRGLPKRERARTGCFAKPKSRSRARARAP